MTSTTTRTAPAAGAVPIRRQPKQQPAPTSMPPPQPRPMLTTEQVARRLHVDPATVRRWLAEGLLAGVKPGGRWRVEPEALAAFIEAGTKRSRPLTEGQTHP